MSCEMSQTQSRVIDNILVNYESRIVDTEFGPENQFACWVPGYYAATCVVVREPGDANFCLELAFPRVKDRFEAVVPDYESEVDRE